LQGPRSLEHVTIHNEAQADGSFKWQRVTAKYDAQGYSEIKKEDLQNYTGSPVDKAVLSSPNNNATSVFDNQVADLSNFLGWMAEPMQLERKQMGVWVLLFLAFFFVVAWRLNAAYWKHVK